ncbi:sugar efflux transporter [Deinococcus cavernae]|uniref:sugar efflux transporter n=1 Tax=Deinococcus cavernae TaxID=2320857 RepID=UPI0018F5B7C5|nr:sugar efflux transporter [Deinococcus cavernae]
MRTAAPPDANILGRVWRLPHVPALTLSVFMLGFGLSMAMPYMSLFGVKAVGMTPLQLGVFLTLNAVSAVLVGTRLARWSDRWTRRKPLVLVTLAAGLTAYLLLSGVRSYPGVVATGLIFMGTAAAAFPQVFAFARVSLTGAPGDLPERAVTVLRSVFSLAWVVGPGLGAAVLARWGFQGTFVVTAACFVLAALPLLGVPEKQPPRHRAAPAQAASAPAPTGKLVWWVALAFVLYATSMSMGMTMFPLFITETLRGSEGQVGFLVGLCALLEIPVMLALATLRGLPGTQKLVKGAFLLFAVHFALIYFSSGLPLLVTTQAIRAAVLAVTAGLGMLYFQELMPGRFAAATTMFANTSAVGGMLAGILSGAAAQWFGYRAVFLLCAALTFGGWMVMQFIVKKKAA